MVRQPFVTVPLSIVRLPPFGDVPENDISIVSSSKVSLPSSVTL